MNERIAWFDMDGSLFDFDGHLRKSLIPLCSPDELKLLYSMGLSELEKAYPHIEARTRLIKDLPGWWRDMPPLESGFEVFRMAQSVGFDCRILTKGPKLSPIAWMEKVQCCHEHLGDKIDIAIVSSEDDKGEVYGRVLYDDYRPNMEAWLQNRPRGLGIMPVTESNKDFVHPNVVKYDGTNVDAVQAALQKAWDRQSQKPLVLT
jgi:hypothetical protein